MSRLHTPEPPVGVGFSFEGIVNNGAIACGVEAFGAYDEMRPGGLERAGMQRIVDPKEFTSDIRESSPYQAFTLLRPLVAKAGDYLPVVQVITAHPQLVLQMIADPTNKEAFAPAIALYHEFKAAHPDDWQAFGVGDGSFFYRERARLQAMGREGWEGLQSPYPDAVEELRALAQTMELRAPDEFVRGFVPYFASSKDAASIYSLCLKYAAEGRMARGDVEGEKCVISRSRILDKSVGGGDKVVQLARIAEELSIPRERVVRVDDRYDAKEVAALQDGGFPHVVVMEGGYVFPWDLDIARQPDSGVLVLPRKGFAEQLAAASQAWGL
ncbi:MAG: hypothetical protein HY520_01245 [Candidatus Aenigmarchaeota archaeon]|nr:hypothetical protein [Candidatus Aenigmarchaeota archaeon]